MDENLVLSVGEVSMSVPLLIRLFELCREGVKSDAELHFLIQQIIQEQAVRGNSALTMDDYFNIEEYKKRFILFSQQLKGS